MKIIKEFILYTIIIILFFALSFFGFYVLTVLGIGYDPLY